MTRTWTRYMVVVNAIMPDNSRLVERQFFVNEFSERGALAKVRSIIRNQGGYIDDGTERPLVQRAEMQDDHEDYYAGYREEHTGEFGKGTVSGPQEAA